MKLEDVQEHQDRVNLGDKAKKFVVSDDWLSIVKPIIDSMIKGLTDARTIDVSSDKKAAIEVKSRTIAAEYLGNIEVLINAYVMDGNISKKLLERQNNPDPDSLYKEEE